MNNNNENKNKQQQTGNDNASKNSTVKRTFAKRWTFPVIYLAASVLIVGLMYAKSKDATPYQINPSTPSTPTKTTQPVGPQLPDNAKTASASPNFIWPVGDDGSAATISMGFFHDTDSPDQQAKEVVAYQNSFTPHEGTDIGLKSDAPFTVVSAAKGTVTNVSLDPLMGYTVTIDNGNGYTTYYASLSGVDVKKGDNVLQGQPIAKSGDDRFESAAKNHLHFELRQNGVSIDPNTILPKMPVGNDATTTSTTPDSTSASNPSSVPAASDNNNTPAESDQPSTSTGAGTDTSQDQSQVQSQDQSTSTDQSSQSDQSGDSSTNSDSGATDQSAGSSGAGN